MAEQRVSGRTRRKSQKAAAANLSSDDELPPPPLSTIPASSASTSACPLPPAHHGWAPPNLTNVAPQLSAAAVAAAAALASSAGASRPSHDDEGDLPVAGPSGSVNGNLAAVQKKKRPSNGPRTQSAPTVPPGKVPVYLAPTYTANPAGPASSATTDFVCSQPGCGKIYKGKHARSIWRRHLQDKHGIMLKDQPRRTRWDNDANRPKSEEERKIRSRESKKRWATKNRRDRSGTAGTANSESAEPEDGFDGGDDFDWNTEAAGPIPVVPNNHRRARSGRPKAIMDEPDDEDDRQESDPYALPPPPTNVERYPLNHRDPNSTYSEEHRNYEQAHLSQGPWPWTSGAPAPPTYPRHPPPSTSYDLFHPGPPPLQATTGRGQGLQSPHHILTRRSTYGAEAPRATYGYDISVLDSKEGAAAALVALKRNSSPVALDRTRQRDYAISLSTAGDSSLEEQDTNFNFSRRQSAVRDDSSESDLDPDAEEEENAKLEDHLLRHDSVLPSVNSLARHHHSMTSLVRTPTPGIFRVALDSSPALADSDGKDLDSGDDHHFGSPSVGIRKRARASTEELPSSGSNGSGKRRAGMSSDFDAFGMHPPDFPSSARNGDMGPPSSSSVSSFNLSTPAAPRNGARVYLPSSASDYVSAYHQQPHVTRYAPQGLSSPPGPSFLFSSPAHPAFSKQLGLAAAPGPNVLRAVEETPGKERLAGLKDLDRLSPHKRNASL